MKRYMVNFKDEEVAEALVEKAAAEDRSVSNYLARLAEKDLRAAGLLPPEPVKKNVKPRGKR